MGGEREKSLAQQLASLAVELSRAPAVEETVEMVVEYARQGIGCTAAGIALNNGGLLDATVVTDPLVRQLYDIQLTTGEGPMISASDTSETILVGDVRRERRWPAWSELALSFGLRTVLQVPLTAGVSKSGVLTLCSLVPDAFDEEDLAAAELVAHYASAAISSAREMRNLQESVESRRLIGQAIGVLMMRHHLSRQDAFEVLKRYSQETNTRLRDVAQQLMSPEGF